MFALSSDRRQRRSARIALGLGLTSLALAGFVPAAAASTHAQASALATAPSSALITAAGHTEHSHVSTDGGLRDPDGNVVIVDPVPDGVLPATGTVAGVDDLSFSVAAAPKAKKKLKTLVVPVYWSGAGKDKVTTKTLKTMMKKTDAYFRTVSAGRIGHTSKVLGWTSIARPAAKCGLTSQMGHLISKVEAAAKKKGLNPKKFDRIVIYVTSKACNGAQPEAGLASLPGRHTLLNGYTDISVVTHELGHNLGLEHANYADCNASKSKRITLGKPKQCDFTEYADLTDTMGAWGISSWFSGPRLAALKWLTKAQLKSNTSGKAKKYSLVPVAGTAKGAKVLRVKASSTRTYWVEYRAAVGLDKALGKSAGVQVRVTDWKLGQSGTRSAVLDMFPSTTAKSVTDSRWDDWRDVALRPGSSWTSPEGVRIAVTKQTKSKASITVSRKVKAAKPAKPAKVKATNADQALKVTWARPADKGMPITAYKLTATPKSGKKVTTTIASPGGTVTSGFVKGLVNGQSYTVSVAAVTEKGTSKVGKSGSTAVAAILPRLTVLSPTASATVGKHLKLEVLPRRGVGSTAPLDMLKVCLDAAGYYCDYAWNYDGTLKDGKKVTFTFDMTQISAEAYDGTAPVYVELVDERNRRAKVTRTINLQRAPTIRGASVPTTIQHGSKLSVELAGQGGLAVSAERDSVEAVVTFTHPTAGKQEYVEHPQLVPGTNRFEFTWSDATVQPPADAPATVTATVKFLVHNPYTKAPKTVTVTRQLVLPVW